MTNASEITGQSLRSQNLDFLNEKVFSYGIAVFMLLVLSVKGMADAYLILGHAHFMMTALYQYKNGRLTPLKFLIYGVAFYAIFQIAYMIPKAFTLFVSAFLLVHVFSGEIRHLGKAYTRSYFTMTLCLMFLMCAWLVIKLWGLSFSVVLLTIPLNAMAAVTAYFFYKKNSFFQANIFFHTLVVLYVAYVVLEYIGFRPDPIDAFGFIVVAHYMSTYFNVTKSFRKKGEGKSRIFIFESISMNLLFLAGYIWVFFYLGTDNVLHDYVYYYLAFYVWTLMHFLTTWNWDEYRHVLKADE